VGYGRYVLRDEFLRLTSELTRVVLMTMLWRMA
jgi:hypothetical protein